MKFKLDLSSLQKSIKNIAKVVPSNPQLPILSSILFEFKKNKLTLSATDLYLGIRMSIPTDNEEEISVAVPGIMFKDIVNSLNSDELTLNINEKSMKVVAGTSEIDLPISKPGEYPDFPSIDGDEVELSSEKIEEIDNLVSFSASRDQVRPILTTILFNFHKEGLEVAATDGFRLAVLNFDQLKFKKQQKILVPIQAFEEVCRIVDQTEAGKVKIQISEELKQIKVMVDQNEIFIRLIEGDYPPYKKIIPESFKTKLEIPGLELEQEFKKAAIIAREASNIVQIKTDKKDLVIKSITSAFGEYTGRIPVSKSGKSLNEIEVAFDVRYLLDFFSSVKPELVNICVNESLKPVAFNLLNRDDFTYVVMPFRVND